jgi:hypothetical protein
MSDSDGAAAKVGCGCLMVLVIVGLCANLLGGADRIDRGTARLIVIIAVGIAVTVLLVWVALSHLSGNRTGRGGADDQSFLFLDPKFQDPSSDDKHQPHADDSDQK